MDVAAQHIDRACATALGRRSENQDRGVVTAGLGVVSDGVGGHAGGARAADLTVEAVVGALAGLVAGSGGAPAAGDTARATLDEASMADAVADAVRRANDAVRRGRADDLGVARMGATVALAAALEIAPGCSRWLVANVGDSPAWLVTATRCLRLTHDHTLTAELVRAGSIDAAAAGAHPGRHVLARAIGPEVAVVPDVVPVDLGAGETLVLASDGLADVLGPEDIHRQVAAGADAPTVARRLVEAALDADASDNVTVAVLRQLASSTDGPLPRHPG